MMKFYKRGDRNAKTQTFDKEKITITKSGKTYNVYDAIQAANIDTDIYEVLKKYNCTTDEATEIMKQKGGLQGVFAEVAELQEKCQTIGDIMKLKSDYEEKFLELPLEVRNKYGHDLNKFLDDVEKFKKQKQIKPEEQPEGVNNNEQK